MSNFNPFGGMAGFDPSKMSPDVLMKLSELVRQLPPEKLQQMQSLMHNLNAGFDVRPQMEAFEKSLPPGFREKLLEIMMSQSSPSTPTPTETNVIDSEGEMNLHQARMTILRGVHEGKLSPEEAEKLLFHSA